MDEHEQALRSIVRIIRAAEDDKTRIRRTRMTEAAESALLIALDALRAAYPGSNEQVQS